MLLAIFPAALIGSTMASCCGMTAESFVHLIGGGARTSTRYTPGRGLKDG
jgi:hypothetical protein